MQQQYIYLLGKHGLTFRSDYIQEGDYSEIGGYDCMCRLIQSGRAPGAVIAINDFTAAGALKAAFENSYSVPGDISVISFDNTFLSEVVHPKLT
jgi:LacI family transcriptional regulator